MDEDHYSRTPDWSPTRRGRPRDSFGTEETPHGTVVLSNPPDLVRSLPTGINPIFPRHHPDGPVTAARRTRGLKIVEPIPLPLPLSPQKVKRYRQDNDGDLMIVDSEDLEERSSDSSSGTTDREFIDSDDDYFIAPQSIQVSLDDLERLISHTIRQLPTRQLRRMSQTLTLLMFVVSLLLTLVGIVVTANQKVMEMRLSQSQNTST